MPVFGMCYGFQAMAQALGGTVAHTGLREYGATPARVSDTASTLFNGQPADAVGVDVPRRLGAPRPPPGCGSPRPPPGAASPRSRTTSAGCTACSGTPR